MNRTLKRIHRVLREIKEAHGGIGIPTLEQFCKEWTEMDALSKSIYETIAECPEIFGDLSEYDKTMVGYMEQMGLVMGQHSLTEILDRFGGNAVG